MKDAEFNIDIYTLVEVLKMSTRYHYEEELAKINDSVFAMGADIEEAIDKTILSFRNLDTKLAIEIMKHARFWGRTLPPPIQGPRPRK